MCVSCECFRSQKYKNNFKKSIFIVFFLSFHLDFSKGPLLHSKRVRFASQKDSFCWVKGLVLQCKRTPFGNPLDFKWKVKIEKWRIRWISSEKWKEKSEESGGLICCITSFCRMPQKSTPNSIYYRKMKKNSRKSFVFAKNFLPLHPQSSRQDCSSIMLQ